MTPEAEEPFEIDIEPSEHYMRHEMRLQRDKARTANRVAFVLVLGIVGALPVYLLGMWLKPEAADRFMEGFEKWLTIVSTLGGTAIGAYYGARIERNSREANHD